MILNKKSNFKMKEVWESPTPNIIEPIEKSARGEGRFFKN